MISVHLGEIPDEGLRISGETTRDIFELEPSENDVAPAGPVAYDLLISDVGEGLLLARGSLSAPFSLRCVACLEMFPFTIGWENYAADFDTPANGELDLTERIREDLLLELPGHPHCDRDGDDPDHACPAAGKYQIAGEGAAEGEEKPGQGPSAWDALDGLSDKDS